jgi:hypothetical protein
MWFTAVLPECVEKCAFKFQVISVPEVHSFLNCIHDPMFFLRHIVDMVCGKYQ